MVSEAYIIRRHLTPWATHARRYASTGRYDPAEFLPDPLPPGFPDGFSTCIDLWNSELSVDFFTCRARLATISEQSIRAVKGAQMRDVSMLESALDAIRKDTRSLCFFIDDDDWYAPHLVETLNRSFSRVDAVRWPDLLFNGRLYYRPVHRLFPFLGFRLLELRAKYAFCRGWLPAPLCGRSRRAGLPVRPIDFLFQTNNYGLTGQFLKERRDINEVIDHVRASSYFTKWRLPIKTLPGEVLSVTNKHPCSATHLAAALQGRHPAKALRAWVERFVEQGRDLMIPERLSWIGPLIDQTLELFETALRR